MPADELFEKFWTHPEYSNAWKLCLEDTLHKRSLLCQLFDKLPTQLGRVEFSRFFPDGRLLCLFTHNYDNEGARKNEFRMLASLANTGALMMFGTEGTFGRVDIDRFKTFEDQGAVYAVAEYLFRERRISPLVAVHFMSTPAIEVWGFDDPVLYEAASLKLATNASDYWQTIERRLQVLFENFLVLVSESGGLVGGHCTEHTFREFHRLLSERAYSHVGIRATEEGETVFGRAAADIKRVTLRPTVMDRLHGAKDKDKDLERERYKDWRGQHNLPVPRTDPVTEELIRRNRDHHKSINLFSEDSAERAELRLPARYWLIILLCCIVAAVLALRYFVRLIFKH